MIDYENILFELYICIKLFMSVPLSRNTQKLPKDIPIQIPVESHTFIHTLAYNILRIRFVGSDFSYEIIIKVICK